MPAAPAPETSIEWGLSYLNRTIWLFFSIVLSFVTFPMMGGISLVTSGFSQTYLGVVGIFIAIVRLIPARFRSIYIRGLALGNSLLALILMVDVFVVRPGWLPFPAFTYPSSPAGGGDVPPVEQWPGFFVNLIFWFAIGIVISWKLPIKKQIRRWVWGVVLVYTILHISGQVLLLFD